MKTIILPVKEIIIFFTNILTGKLFKQHVVVASHRRSGTHVTIDSILNNFNEDYPHPYVNIDYMKDEKVSLIKDFRLLFKLRRPRVLKTHSSGNPEKHLSGIRLWIHKKLFDNSEIIYISREPKDVLTSYFHYLNNIFGEVEFLNFLTANNDQFRGLGMGNIEYIFYHVNSWKESKWNSKILYLKFSDYIDDYSQVINRIAKHFNLKVPSDIINIIGNKSIPRKTSVSFRKGKRGDHLSLFNKRELDYYNKIYSSVKDKYQQ